MIQMQTMLDVADNSGAKSARCIKVLGGSRRRYAGLGDIVVVAVQKSLAGSAIRSGSVVKGVDVGLNKFFNHGTHRTRGKVLLRAHQALLR